MVQFGNKWNKGFDQIQELIIDLKNITDNLELLILKSHGVAASFRFQGRWPFQMDWIFTFF